jgi:hypothetical protein
LYCHLFSNNFILHMIWCSAAFQCCYVSHTLTIIMPSVTSLDTQQKFDCRCGFCFWYMWWEHLHRLEGLIWYKNSFKRWSHK